MQRAAVGDVDDERALEVKVCSISSPRTTRDELDEIEIADGLGILSA